MPKIQLFICSGINIYIKTKSIIIFFNIQYLCYRGYCNSDTLTEKIVLELLFSIFETFKNRISKSKKNIFWNNLFLISALSAWKLPKQTFKNSRFYQNDNNSINLNNLILFFLFFRISHSQSKFSNRRFTWKLCN